MTSTGNDIVSLRQPDIERAAHPGFYSKILTIQEQELYDSHQLPNLSFTHFVWLLWSVKESAFKYLKRLNTELQFSPIKTVILKVDFDLVQPSVNFSQNYTGCVQYFDTQLYFKSEISTDCIFTVVNDKADFNNIVSGVQQVSAYNYEKQSGLARAFLLDNLANYISGELNIKKSPVGYPILFNLEDELPIPISLSHDGDFVGYTFVFNGLAQTVV